GRAQLARAATQLSGELLDLLAAALAQGARVEVQELRVAKDAAVSVLPECPVARSARSHLVQEHRVVLVRRRRHRTGLRELAPQGAIGHLRGQELTRVASARMGLVDGAIEQDRWNEFVAQVALAVLEVL